MTQHSQNGKGMEVRRNPDDREWDHCPACKTGSLDTGFECNSCGLDALPLVHLQEACEASGDRMHPSGLYQREIDNPIRVTVARQSLAREPATADVGRALEAAARAMCDRVNGAGDYDENLVQRRPGWVPQAKAGIDAYLAALSRAAPSSGQLEDADSEWKTDCWNEFFSKHLTDGNDGYRAAGVIAACRAAFDAAWPDFEKADADALAVLSPSSGHAKQTTNPYRHPDYNSACLACNRRADRGMEPCERHLTIASSGHAMAEGERICVGCEGKPAPENNPCAVCGATTPPTTNDAIPAGDTVAFVQEWLMNADYDPSQFDRDFAAAIDARVVAASAGDLATLFCAAPLPDDVCADQCATVQGPGRTGTNLLTVDQATRVFTAALSAAPSAPATEAGEEA